VIELFPFQKEGVKFLSSRNHALLADEMGLGKSAQAIRASINFHSILVICPASAKINWQREFWKFGKIKAYIGGSDDVYHLHHIICSYEYAVKHKDFLYGSGPWDLIIVDESHYLKSHDSSRTAVILGKNGLIHRSKRMWLLSGTPSPNHAGELWTMLYTFGHTKLSYDGFVARYCNSHRTAGYYSRIQITGSNTKHTPELKNILKKVMLRRMKKEVLPELPPLFHSVHYLTGKLDDPFKNLPELKDKMRIELERIKEEIDFKIEPSDDKLLSVLKLMSGSVSALRRYHGLKKVTPVAKLITEELELGLYDKIVVFGIHTDVIYSLEKLLSKFRPVTLTGKTNMLHRQLAIDRFQNGPDHQIFLGNIQAAGTAITLTAAHNVIFIEQDWVPGNNAQAAMRCHRIGQERAVSVRHVCIPNSFDERVTSILTRKTQELSTFL